MHIERVLKSKIISFNSSTSGKSNKGKPPFAQTPIYGSLQSLIDERRLVKQQDLQLRSKNLPSETRMRQMKSRQCTVKLYMNHNQWKSQYIYAVMNYQKLGFTPITNYTLLKHASQFYKVNKKPQSEQFPIMKFSPPIQQPFVLHGIEEIIRFLDQYQLIKCKISNDQVLGQSLKQFIDLNVAKNLEMMFWHPTLTFHSLFHTGMSSYKSASQNYDILTTIYKNTTKICKSIPKNLIKIYSNKEKYMSSRENTQKSLKQIIVILHNQQFIGGNAPSHLDFYLFSILNCKINVKYFQEFLREAIGKEFWMWMYRMRCATKYDRERMTII